MQKLSVLALVLSLAGCTAQTDGSQGTSDVVQAPAGLTEAAYDPEAAPVAAQPEAIPSAPETASPTAAASAPVAAPAPSAAPQATAAAPSVTVQAAAPQAPAADLTPATTQPTVIGAVPTVTVIASNAFTGQYLLPASRGATVFMGTYLVRADDGNLPRLDVGLDVSDANTLSTCQAHAHGAVDACSAMGAVQKGSSLSLDLANCILGGGYVGVDVSCTVHADAPDGATARLRAATARTVAVSANGTRLAVDTLEYNNLPTLTVQLPKAITAVRAADDAFTKAGLVVGGASNVTLAKFTLTAGVEELAMTKAHLKVDRLSAAGVLSLSIYDGAVLLGSSPVDVGGHATFWNMSFVVPANGNKTFTVKADMNAVGASGAATYLDVAVTLVNDTLTTFEGRNGSKTLVQGVPSGDVTGASKRLVKSMPTVALNALPTSSLYYGANVVSRFTVAANAAGDVAFTDITVKSNAAACTATSGLRRIGDGYDQAGTCTAHNGSFTIHLANEMTIAAGTSRSFDLRLVADGSTDEVDATIEAAGFRWSDLSALPHDANSNDWIVGGGYVVDLPSQTQTLTN